MTKRWWISWHQPTDDFRPLSDPPHPQVLGWWCSGYDSDDVPTLVALVEAASEADAKIFVEISWPECERWRFCEERGQSFRPGDRFPLMPWMTERIERID